jgi:hypothetical protein
MNGNKKKEGAIILQKKVGSDRPASWWRGGKKEREKLKIKIYNNKI